MRDRRSFILNLVTTTGGATWAPDALASYSVPYAAFNVQDLSTLFSDRAGTVPAVVDGPVGRMVPAYGSASLYLAAPSDAQRPMLRVSSGIYSLVGDGVDDILLSTAPMFSNQVFLGVSTGGSGTPATYGDELISAGTPDDDLDGSAYLYVTFNYPVDEVTLWAQNDGSDANPDGPRAYYFSSDLPGATVGGVLPISVFTSSQKDTEARLRIDLNSPIVQSLSEIPVPCVDGFSLSNRGYSHLLGGPTYSYDSGTTMPIQAAIYLATIPSSDDQIYLIRWLASKQGRTL